MTCFPLVNKSFWFIWSPVPHWGEEVRLRGHAISGSHQHQSQPAGFWAAQLTRWKKRWPKTHISHQILQIFAAQKSQKRHPVAEALSWWIVWPKNGTNWPSHTISHCKECGECFGCAKITRAPARQQAYEETWASHGISLLSTLGCARLESARILDGSIGGNCRTALLVCVNPAFEHVTASEPQTWRDANLDVPPRLEKPWTPWSLPLEPCVWRQIEQITGDAEGLVSWIAATRTIENSVIEANIASTPQVDAKVNTALVEVSAKANRGFFGEITAAFHVGTEGMIHNIVVS